MDGTDQLSNDLPQSREISKDDSRQNRIKKRKQPSDVCVQPIPVLHASPPWTILPSASVGEIPALVSDRRIVCYDTQGRQVILPCMPPMHPKRGAQPRMSVTASKEKFSSFVVPDETVLTSLVVPDDPFENPGPRVRKVQLVSDDGEIPELVHSDDDER